MDDFEIEMRGRLTAFAALLRHMHANQFANSPDPSHFLQQSQDFLLHQMRFNGRGTGHPDELEIFRAAAETLEAHFAGVRKVLDGAT